jgi:hypothetical protein
MIGQYDPDIEGQQNRTVLQIKTRFIISYRARSEKMTYNERGSLQNTVTFKRR